MKSDVFNEAPTTGARFEPGTEVERLIVTLAQLFYRIDADISKMRNSRTIDDASGLELDKKAREFGVFRPTGEGDDAFRRRAIAGRTRARSEATYEEFAKGVLQYLDADPSDVSLTVDYQDERGAVIVEANSQVIDDSPFSTSTILEQLEGMIPLDRRVVLRQTDGFQFSLSGTTGSKSGKGFSQGTWTS